MCILETLIHSRSKIPRAKQVSIKTVLGEIEKKVRTHNAIAIKLLSLETDITRKIELQAENFVLFDIKKRTLHKIYIAYINIKFLRHSDMIFFGKYIKTFNKCKENRRVKREREDNLKFLYFSGKN